ncbi:MAG: hypothetical protein AAF989_10445 [Planctomycetota bacterium]
MLGFSSVLAVLTDTSALTALFGALVLPLVGGSTLILAKLAQGESVAKAHRRFFACLLVTTIVTLRTVIHCDDLWLIHMSTLAAMILGALVIPGHETSVAV